LLGRDDTGREDLVIEATTRTAYRKENWSMIPPYDGPAVSKHVNIELGNSDEYLLYDLKEDIGQQDNLAGTNKAQLDILIEEFERKK
jgi:hypothetical protein